MAAMMGDTYAKVSENAVAKWRLERARIMLRLERHFSTPHRDRLARGVWIVLDGARFLQVQLVDGLTSYEQRDARDRSRSRPLMTTHFPSSLAVDRRSRARDARVRANAAVAVRPSRRKKVGTPRCRLGADASFRDATIASRDRVDARGRRRDARERQKLKRANERARARSTARRGRGRATR